MSSVVTDPRERVAASLGPLLGDEAAYWATLADWQDWSAWSPPLRAHAPQPTPADESRAIA